MGRDRGSLGDARVGKGETKEETGPEIGRGTEDVIEEGGEVEMGGGGGEVKKVRGRWGGGRGGEKGGWGGGKGKGEGWVKRRGVRGKGRVVSKR